MVEHVTGFHLNLLCEASEKCARWIIFRVGIDFHTNLRENID